MEIDARLPAVQATQTTVDRETGQLFDEPVRGAQGSDFFISPVLRFDSRSLTVIFQVRDSGSGDVIRQFPPETVVARYREDPSARPFTVTAGDASGRSREIEIVGAGSDQVAGDDAPVAGREGVSRPTIEAPADQVDLVA